MDDTIDIKIRIEALKAQAQLATLTAKIDKAAQSQEQMSLKTQILNQRLVNLGDAATKGGKGFTIANVALASFIGNIASRVVSASITSLINGLGGLVVAGKDFEKGLISVAKTTGLGDQAIKELGDEISSIARKIPVSTQSLLDMAVVAGQLGIKGTQNIAAFTETMGKLSVATNVTGEEGSQSVARILTITNELEKNGAQNINRFGNVITKLGNDFATSEAQILVSANEVAKGTASFEVSSTDVLALATALKVTGSEAEVSGTLMVEVFKRMSDAIIDGGEPLQRFAEATGLTREEFEKLFREDPAGAFNALTTGLGQSTARGIDLQVAIENLGFSNKRIVKSLSPLISNYKVLDTSLKTAREEAEKQTALDEEVAKAKQSLAADITQLSNAYDELGKVIFQSVGPALREIVQSTTSFINLISDGRLKSGFEVITAGITATGLAIIALNRAVVASVALKVLAAGLAVVGGFFASIPIAIGVFVTALYAFYKSLDIGGPKLNSFNEYWAQFNKNVESSAEGYKNAEDSTKEFLDTLGEATGVFNNVEAPLVRHKQLLDDLVIPYANAGDVAEDTSNRIAVAAQKVLLFEQQKLQSLKKFFKDEEIAKLESNFAIMKSDADRAALQKIVVSEGEARQSESLKRIIGLDKATIEAARERDAELKKIRDAQFKYEEELKQKEYQNLAELAEAKKMADEAELARQLFFAENDIIFQDQQLEQLVQGLEREEQARIAAQAQGITNETQYQKFLADVRKKAADEELNKFKKRQEQKRLAEAQYNQTSVSNFAQTGELINAIAGKQTKIGFAIGKAAALASIIVNTQASMALATAQLGAYAGPVVAAIKLQGILQGATVAASAITGYQDGGIVPGASTTGDKVMARVNSGEMILNRQQQAALFNMANGQSGSTGQQEIVVHTTVEIDGEAVGRTVSRQVANGLRLGEVQ